MWRLLPHHKVAVYRRWLHRGQSSCMLSPPSAAAQHESVSLNVGLSGGLRSYVKLLPEAGLALLSLAVLLLQLGLIQLLDSALDVWHVHSGGVIWLEKGTEGKDESDTWWERRQAEVTQRESSAAEGGFCGQVLSQLP